MATETTSTAAEAWRPNITTYAATEVVPDALIMRASTIAGAVEGDEQYIDVAYLTDAEAGFTAEADEIPEADPALAEVTVATAKVTQLIRLSAELWRQQATPQRLAESVRRAVTRKANEAFLTQPEPVAPAVAPPAGLLNADGIGSTTAGVETNLDPLVDLVAALEANGASPGLVIVDPLGWAALSKMKVGTGSAQNLLGAGVDQAARRLLGLPVYVTSAMAESAGLVVDPSAVVSAVGPLRVATSEHAYFTRDSIAIKCTWRVGWNLVRPDRIGSFTIGPVTP